MLTETTSATAFRFAEEAIRLVAVTNVAGVANSLLFRVKNASTYHERNQLVDAQKRFVESQEIFLGAFATLLRQGIEGDIRPDIVPGDARAATDWQSIGLVDQGRIEESIGSKRIGQLISHASEAELRELDGYAAAVLRLPSAEEDRNPMRGDVIGTALHRAIEKITEDAVSQKILSREFGHAMAEAMPACYRAIVQTLKDRGVKPVARELKAIDDSSLRPGTSGDGRGVVDELKRAMDASLLGRMPNPESSNSLRSWESSIRGRMGQADPLPSGFDIASASALLDRLMRGTLPAAPLAAMRSPAQEAADQQLTDLLRRIADESAVRADFIRTQRDSGPGLLDTRGGVLGPQSAFGALDSDHLSGLVAVNLIRAHRDQLEQAARSKVDHLVIEVVSSLFDQILSDSRVPPQMARQIARLQLPVLRVAWGDPRFFSSRRHPVRRFINRIASLSSAVEGFDGGAATDLLARVTALVTEIVEGDFDQLAVYDAKLDALQGFVDEQARVLLDESGAAPTLNEKEAEWQAAAAFAVRLAAALEPLALPDFVFDFLRNVWAHAIVVVSRREGEDSAPAKQLRRTMANLVVSLQPKRSMEDRKHFVTTLRSLMSSLTAGASWVGWPSDARDAFFGRLMDLHTGSLKAAPGTDLDHNMRLRQLEAAVRVPIPKVGSPEEAAAASDHRAGLATGAAGAGGLETIEAHFSADEERSIGLVSETAVDWTSAVAVDVDVDLSSAPDAGDPALAADAAAAPAQGASTPPDTSLPTIDATSLDVLPAPLVAVAPTDVEPALPSDPELVSGLALRDNLQLGLSYRLNLKGRWEKVRLTYMSPGRTLFLFSHGAKGRETVSMTTRLLGRLCEAGRLRAFETEYLIERSTSRAREQLAAIGAGPTPTRASSQP